MFEQQIAAGMQWLDRHVPGWEQRIDVNRLGLHDCERCVIGQLVGNYKEWIGGYHQTSLPTVTKAMAVNLGFNTTINYHQLTNEWKSAILARRSRPKGGRVTELRLPRFACDPVADQAAMRGGM